MGVCFGKALAWRLGIPCVGVHHLAGHLAAAELAEPALVPPYLGLVVSGGHTALYRIEESGRVIALGATRDDAVGEAFDKVARILGLPFPGGPAISRAAEGGDPEAVPLPRPLLDRGGLDFSYSGLKTAVALEVERRRPLGPRDVADLAASFEAAAVDVLVAKLDLALEQEGLSRLAVVGGVAANRRLRRRVADLARKRGVFAVFPPVALCTDNAAMIAAAGARELSRGRRAGLDLGVFSRAPLSGTAGGGSARPVG